MRKAFTLIELLVIIGIMGAMVTVSVISVRAGQGAARTRGAVRDVFAAIRHARSVALVTQQPAIITYSTEEEDGEAIAKIEIVSTRLFNATADRSKVETLTGAPLAVPADEPVAAPTAAEPAVGADGKPVAENATPAAEEGQTIEEILFTPIDPSIVRGMRVKVLRADEELDGGAPVRKSRISVFSNVDYLIGRYKEAKTAKKAEETAASDAASAAAPSAEHQEPVSVVWETNGRVEPHRVWVYADGQRPEQGLCIVVDRFGGAKVVSGDGREDD